jgi:hypothetical protein
VLVTCVMDMARGAVAQIETSSAIARDEPLHCSNGKTTDCLVCHASTLCCTRPVCVSGIGVRIGWVSASFLGLQIGYEHGSRNSRWRWRWRNTMFEELQRLLVAPRTRRLRHGWTTTSQRSRDKRHIISYCWFRREEMRDPTRWRGCTYIHTYIHAVYAYSALVSSGRGMDVTHCWVAVASGLRPTIPATSPTPDRLL